ncbi:MAG: hypothetical protein M3125_09440, partial [Gemmatimonadota bacterium]|nr:hypothetical protein [Gemmatimonadota bacterium]
MNDRRRPPRRGRGPRPTQPRPTLEANDTDVNPYREDATSRPDGGAIERDNGTPAPGATPQVPTVDSVPQPGSGPSPMPPRHPNQHPHHPGGGRDRFGQNGRRGRRGRGRGGPRPDHQGGASVLPAVIVAEGEAEGWFDSSRDGGFIRKAGESYL